MWHNSRERFGMLIARLRALWNICSFFSFGALPPWPFDPQARSTKQIEIRPPFTGGQIARRCSGILARDPDLDTVRARVPIAERQLSDIKGGAAAVDGVHCVEATMKPDEDAATFVYARAPQPNIRVS